MDKANLSQLKEARSMLHSLRQRNATIDSDLEFFRSNKDALSNFFSMANNHAEGLKGFIESTDSQAVAEKLLAKSRPEDRPAVTFVIENRKELAHLADHFRLDRPDRDGMPVGITSIDIVEFLGDNSKEIGRIAHFVNAHPKEMDEVLDILQEKAKKGQNPGFKDFLSHPGLAWFAVRNAGELNHIRLFVEKNMDSFDGYSVAQNSKEIGEVISFAQRHRPDFPKLAAATAWLEKTAQPMILEKQEAYDNAQMELRRKKEEEQKAKEERSRFEEWKRELHSGNEWSQRAPKLLLENYKYDFSADPKWYRERLKRDAKDPYDREILKMILPEMKKAGLPVPDEIEKELGIEKLKNEPLNDEPEKAASLFPVLNYLRQGMGNLLSRHRTAPALAVLGSNQPQFAV